MRLRHQNHSGLALAGRSSQTGAGFTLLELLLVLVVIMLLAGAAAFNFSALKRGAELDEGAFRFESLLRFARAEAANTGHRIQIQFEPKESTDEGEGELYEARITCEMEPLSAPGVYSKINNAAWMDDQLTDLISVEAVKPIGVAVVENMEEQDLIAQTEPSGFELETRAEPARLPTITFYPDGSSDSAQITLASTDPEDERRVQLRLVGLTGYISRMAAVETEASEADNETSPSQALPENRNGPANSSW